MNSGKNLIERGQKSNAFKPIMCVWLGSRASCKAAFTNIIDATEMYFCVCDFRSSKDNDDDDKKKK